MSNVGEFHRVSLVGLLVRCEGKGFVGLRSSSLVRMPGRPESVF